MCPQGKIEGAVLIMAKFDSFIRKVKHCLEAPEQSFVVTHRSELGHGHWGGGGRKNLSAKEFEFPGAQGK